MHSIKWNTVWERMQGVCHLRMNSPKLGRNMRKFLKKLIHLSWTVLVTVETPVVRHGDTDSPVTSSVPLSLGVLIDLAFSYFTVIFFSISFLTSLSSLSPSHGYHGKRMLELPGTKRALIPLKRRSQETRWRRKLKGVVWVPWKEETNSWPPFYC